MVSAATAPHDFAAIGDETVELLQRLIRFDTTNPPGNELECARFVADWLSDAGLEPTLIESGEGRGNVITRIKGNGELPPLLMCAHLDVVPAEPSSWEHPPFAAEIHGGYIWGRGAIDMKHMAAMSMQCLKLMKAAGTPLRRDVIFAAVADEEAGCDYGSRFLVDNHADEVRAEYMLGEVGGFTQHMGGLRIYPVQVAEKGLCWLRMTARGEPGHGSMPREDNAVVSLAKAISRIGSKRLPQHDTEVMRNFFGQLGDILPKAQGLLLRQLLNPKLSTAVLSVLRKKDASLARTFGALLSNTASPTVLRGGSKTNVIPSSASVEIDGRTLPGQTAEDLIEELRVLAGKEVEFEVLQDAPPVVTEVDTPMFDAIKRGILAHDPEGIVVPTMIPGFTDAKAFSRLGTRCYGFSPLSWPDDGVKFSALFHGHNERVPVDGLKWGVEVLHHTVADFCGA